MSRLVEKVDFTTLAPNVEEGRETLLLKSQAQEDAIFRAREKLERWVQPISELCRYRFVSLVDAIDSSSEGLFEAAEFALVPSLDLKCYRESCDEARAMLDHMEEQLEAALMAREAEEE